MSGTSYAKDSDDGSSVQFSAEEFSGGWTKVTKDEEDTSEPTSGLLLLVGMAGLALKRKRA